MSENFTALQVNRNEDKTFTRRIVQRNSDDLPAGELLVRVQYSSLNYKDALSASGHPGVTRNFPHTPGIDAAGQVVSCSDGRFQPGDQVIVTSYDLGMETDGGFGQLIRVPSAWAVALPDGLSLKQSMIFGTAGLTAALSVTALVDSGLTPDQGPVLVTGATGGVGSLAVTVLTRAGFQVTAATGKNSETDYLKCLGATNVISREEVTANSERPMLKPLWSGVVDCVGGTMLEAAIKACRYDGVVTCCGLVGSADLNLNVFPFILRGVRLIGIDSAECPMPRRLHAWQYLAENKDAKLLEQLSEEISLEGLEEKIQAMLKGQVKRRVVVRL